MIDLTAAGGPIFATRSRINSESRDYGVFTASSMQEIMARIVDGDPESYWHSAVGGDAITETLIASVQLRSALVNRPVDMICLQNINLKNFKLEYSTGGVTYLTVPGFDYSVGTADNDQSDLIKTFSEITPDHYRLTMYRTIVADEVKKVGGIIASLSTVQITTGGMVKYDRKHREELRSLKMGDGSRSDEAIRRSAVSYEHYGAAVEIELLSKAERDAMRGIKRTGAPFVFVPEPYDSPRDAFGCLFKGVWDDRFTSQYKGTGYTVGFNVEEVGDL